MKLGYRFLVLGVALGFGIALSSCGNEEAERQARADSIARVKRVQDSIAQVRADSAARAEALAAEEAESSSESGESAGTQPNENMKFHVIKGSFTIPSNADNFLQVQLAQYPQAKIFTAPNGYKLVSIADFDNMNEAIQMVNRLSNGAEENAAYWVYEEGGPYNTASWLEEKGTMDDEYAGDDSADDAYTGDDSSNTPATTETSDYEEE